MTTIESYAFLGCTNLKTLYIPYSVKEIHQNVFYECGVRTVIIDSEQGIIDGEPWGANHGTQIIYKDNPEYKYIKFAISYLENKSQKELEELMLKSVQYTGTFEEYLNEGNMTREDIEQMAQENGMEYVEYLKYTLKNMEYSWVYVEYTVSEQGGAEKTIEELEQMFVEKNGGTGSFDDFLSQGGMNREDFENKIKEEGFRAEEDFLKVYIYIR